LAILQLDLMECVFNMHLRMKYNIRWILAWRTAGITDRQAIPTFVLDPLGIGNHQKAGCVPAPRESHPSEVLSELPPLVATVLSRSTLWLDRSIIILAAPHGHYR